MGIPYYKSLLSVPEKAAYDEIVGKLRKFEKTITVSLSDAEQITRSYEAVRMDTPELFFLGSSWSFLKGARQSEIQLKWLYSDTEAASLLTRMKGIADDIAADVRGMSEQQAATYIHDYLVKNVTYSSEINGRLEAHSIVGALIHKRCVCEGYAKAYKFLCNTAGVRCIIVAGKADGDGGGDGHCWNMVRLGEDRCFVDPTFDHLIDDTYCSRAFLFGSDEDYRRIYTPSSKFPIPHAPKSRMLLTRVRGLDGLFKAMAQDCKGRITHSEYALDTFADPQYLINTVANRLDSADRCVREAVGGLFVPQTTVTNVIGVKWRR